MNFRCEKRTPCATSGTRAWVPIVLVLRSQDVLAVNAPISSLTSLPAGFLPICVCARLPFLAYITAGFPKRNFDEFFFTLGRQKHCYVGPELTVMCICLSDVHCNKPSRFPRMCRVDIWDFSLKFVCGPRIFNGLFSAATGQGRSGGHARLFI